LTGCLTSRLLLIGIAYHVLHKHTKYSNFLALFALVIGIGFWSIYLTNSRQTGRETFGEKIWWNQLRPVHGTLWIAFAILAFKKKSWAWMLLLVDMVIGLIAFTKHHF